VKKITVEKVILVLAAGFAAWNFGLAGGYIERGDGFSIGGLAAGVVVNVSLAIASSRYGSLKGDKRTRQAQAAFLAMLVLSPVLVSPVVYYSLPETFLGVWWLRALWSVAWPLVADLAIVLAGAVSGKGLIALTDASTTLSTSATQSDAGATDSARGARKVRRTATQSATESDGLRRNYPRKCEHCDAQVQSPNAVGAHMKKHHPELCRPKASLAEALFAGKAGEK
jgi:hypothetical protein